MCSTSGRWVCLKIALPVRSPKKGAAKAGSFERETINEEDLHTEEVLTDRTHYPSTERPFVILQINDRTDEPPHAGGQLETTRTPAGTDG
jgi:hypothetical protein